MNDKNSVLSVLDKSTILAPSLDKSQMHQISEVVSKHQRILGYNWTSDAKRIIKRTDYDIKETTFLTTVGVITPMIFIKWMTLFKRLGLSVAVGIPLGYWIGKHESAKTLTNLCDTSDQEIGKQIRDSIFSKGYTSVASQYLIARGYGDELHPAVRGDLNKVKISDDYERTGKAYTKIVNVEGDINDIVYILNQISVNDMRSFGRPDHKVGVEGTLTPCLKHYKAVIKVHSVPKKKSFTGKEKKEDKLYIESDKKKPIDKEMESIFSRHIEEAIDEEKQKEAALIKEKILKSTINEVTSQQIHEMQDIIKKRNQGIHVEKKIHKAKTLGDLEREKQQQQQQQQQQHDVDIESNNRDLDSLRSDMAENNNDLNTVENPNSQYTQHIHHHHHYYIHGSVYDGTNTQSSEHLNESHDTSNISGPNPKNEDDYLYIPSDDEDNDDYDYLCEDIAGTPLPVDRPTQDHSKEPEYFNDILTDVLGFPIPTKTKENQDSKEDKNKNKNSIITEVTHTDNDIHWEKKQEVHVQDQQGPLINKNIYASKQPNIEHYNEYNVNSKKYKE